MSDYVRWFCEEFLGEGYDNKNLLSIWMTMKKNNANSELNYQSFKITQNQQQLTIFDI